MNGTRPDWCPLNAGPVTVRVAPTDKPLTFDDMKAWWTGRYAGRDDKEQPT